MGITPELFLNINYKNHIMKINFKLNFFLFTACLICLSSKSFSQTEKEKYIAKITTDVEAIFDGEIVGYGNSFYSNNGKIYTEIIAKVKYVNYGSISTQTITLAKEGGSLDGREYTVSDASPIFKTNASFFLYKGFAVQNKLSNQTYYLINQIGFDNKQQIIGDNKGFQNYNELFEAINQKMPIKFEKKSPNETAVRRKADFPAIDYKTRSENFQNIIKQKEVQFASNFSARTSQPLAADVTLQVTNGSVNGSYYEFDINIKSNNSTSYLENMPVWLTYNTAPFGTNIVAGNKVQVTNGTTFNNSNYLPANNYMADQASNTFAFAMSTDPALSNPNRVNITTSYKLLAHVKILISNCGSISVTLSNASTAINTAFYTPTATGGFSTAQNYTALNYAGSLSANVACSPTIIDFNTDLRGGVDTLKIKGYGFGTAQIGGEVKFRNADISNFPYIPVLDALDYLSWTDTMIKIKLPGYVANQMSSNGVANTPGTGSFIVENDLGQTVTSANNLQSKPFRVYYALKDKIYNSTKTKAHVVGKGIDNNYELYCDSSIGKHPYKLAIVKKAVRDWACLTTINIDVIYDSTVVNTNNINYITFASFSPGDVAVARTGQSVGSCNLTSHNAILEFDVEIDRAQSWLYDTTGANLPTNYYDFYAVVVHEIGHCFGLMHIINTQSIMYFQAQSSSSGPISGSTRKKLLPNSPEADGGLYQVFSSVSAINSTDLGCSLKDITPYNSNCTIGVSVKELQKSNFNIIVYPNPSSDGIINLSFDAVENSSPKIQVYNMLGSIVYQETIEKESGSNHYIKTLNLDELSNGVYILNLIMGSDKASYKLIKQ